MTMHTLNLLATWAWETSLAASLLILLSFAVRRFLPVSIRTLLGLLILARLLLPFSPASSLSAFNFVPRNSEVISAAPVISAPTTDILPPLTLPVPTQKILSPRDLLPGLWSLGALVFFARIILQHTNLRRTLRDSEPVTSGSAVEMLQQAKASQRIYRAIQLRSTPRLKVPALFGFFRPCILIPHATLESAAPETLRLIFLHELAHVRRWHIPINWLVILAQSLHWFNPLTYLAFRRLRADQEILCDADVIRILQPHDHRTYGEALLALASDQPSPPAPLYPSPRTSNK